MNCFKLESKTAEGVCKNCSKGICRQCVVEYENGIVCSDSCKTKILRNELLLDQAYKAYDAGSTYHNTVFKINTGFGILSLVAGIIFTITQKQFNLLIVVALVIFLFTFPIKKYSKGLKIKKHE